MKTIYKAIIPYPRWQEKPVLDDNHWVGRFQYMRHCYTYGDVDYELDVGIEAIKQPYEIGDVIEDRTIKHIEPIEINNKFVWMIEIE